MSVITDDEIRSVVLREVGSFVPRRAIALTDDLEHDLRLLSDDAAELIMALERQFDVKLPQSRLNAVHRVSDLADLFVEFRKRGGDPALDKELHDAEASWIDGGPIRPRPLSSVQRFLGFLGVGLGAIFLCAAIIVFIEVGPEQKGFWIAIFLSLVAFVSSASLLARK